MTAISLPHSTGWRLRVQNRRSLQRCGLRAAVVQPVEEQLERAVRLISEVHLRTKQYDLSLSNSRFRDRCAAVQVVLPPGPAAREQVASAEPSDRVGLLDGGRGLHAEYRAIVIEHIHRGRHAVCQRVRVIDLRAQKGARNVEFLAGQLPVSAVRTFFYQMVLHGQAEYLGDAGRAADGYNAAAALHELFEGGHRLLIRNPSQPIAIFGRDALRVRRPSEAAAPAAASTRPATPNRAVCEDDHVILALEIAR